MGRVKGLIILFLAILVLWEGRNLPVGTLQRPGSGFFPFLVALVLIILSLIAIVSGRKKKDEGEPFSGKLAVKVLIVFTSLLAYFVFLEYLGFIIVSFLLMAFLFIVMDFQKWQSAVVKAFVTTGLAYLLFEVLLMGNLPKGVFGF